MSIQWFNPMTDTPEGLLLGDVQSLLKAILEKKAKKKQKPKTYKSDRGQRPMPNMPSPEGNKNKIDKTTEILQEMGIVKYSQESSVDNQFPHFENVDGGVPVRAHGFTTNQTYPATSDGPKKSIVSETAKIPAYAQKGYTVKSSSLHMHYNDAGGTRKNAPNIDTIEQRLASLTKHSGRNNLGMIGEIEGLLKQVKDLIESPSN
jgi:hypothetical protein